MRKAVWFLALGLLVGTAGCKSSNARRAEASGGSPDPAALMKAPSVTFKDLQGADVSLDHYQGKVVLLNFWATWCEPCQDEIPWLIDFQKKYGDQGFTVLGAAMDDEGAKVVQPYVQNHQFDVQGQKLTMNYPIVIANDAIADKFGGLIGYPTSYLISRDGRIIKRVIGIIHPETMETDIQNLLKTK